MDLDEVHVHLQSLNDSILPLMNSGKQDIVKSILVEFYSPFFTEPHNLLHCSVEFCNDDLISYLLQIGFNVNAQDSKGCTPLMLAVKANSNRIINSLLRAGADIDIVNNDKESALSLACAHHSSLMILHWLFNDVRNKCSSSEEVAERLIHAGCFLYQAVHMRDAVVLEHMLKQGCLVNAMDPKTKQTALHVAVQLVDLDCVTVLLRYGANANLSDIEGIPLFYLCKYKGLDSYEEKEILKGLLSQCTPSLFIDSDLLSNIDSALIYGDAQVIEILFRSNLPLTIEDKTTKRTLLHYLAKNVQPGVLKELKLHINNYNVNAIDRWGESPLHFAVKVINVDMVEFLLEQGAKTDFAHTISGATALTHAYNFAIFDSNTERCAELLLQHNANPQATFNSNGREFTIFDDNLQTKNYNQMKSAIAHLAMLQMQGTPIKEIIRSKIDSCDFYKKYFNQCQWILTKKISGGVTVFKLLTEDKNKIVGYLKRKKFVRKLMRLRYKQTFRLAYLYYYSILEKRLTKISQREKLEVEAASTICRIFEDRCNADDLVIDKITNYLANQDLQRLCELQKIR